MRYTEFRDQIQQELRRDPSGITWVELKDRLNLPYKTPCPTWVHRLENEIALIREKGLGRAFIWKVKG